MTLAEAGAGMLLISARHPAANATVAGTITPRAGRYLIMTDPAF